MIHKSKAREHLKNFFEYVKLKFQANVCIHPNNGQEFNMPDYYFSHGIEYQCLCVHSP